MNKECLREIRVGYTCCHVCMYLYNIDMYICIYAYIGICIYVCMYVCIYVYTYIYIYIERERYTCMYICIYELFRAPDEPARAPHGPDRSYTGSRNRYYYY